MILTVTLNAAIDDTYEVPGARFGEVNRVETVHRRPGGKGVNVARVLHGLGREVVAAGLAAAPRDGRSRRASTPSACPPRSRRWPGSRAGRSRSSAAA
ncbi:PfkB family carbohydrate kinase [Actinomadura madurae]|uniref:PfkB family carbohydrate kinase n=1 Tax=Actinomadura madurae TaxID=1993 RepID=UPI0020D23807|nr:PfkB family carbohydrate kinase [Actinomadura madurae]MCQ0010821.1 PfkB family carbohydrate kinase [Actinomadura madurae]